MELRIKKKTLSYVNASYNYLDFAEVLRCHHMELQKKKESGGECLFKDACSPRSLRPLKTLAPLVA
jgi:hypothetical protein